MPIFARIHAFYLRHFAASPAFDSTTSPTLIRAEIARLKARRWHWDCEKIDKHNESLPCLCWECTEIARLERLLSLTA